MDHRHFRVICLLAALTLGGLMHPGYASAGSETAEADLDPGYRPPVYRDATISLMEAVRITLEHEPTIRLQTESTEFSRGVAQEATGQFDTALLGDFSYEFVQEELNSQAIAAEEKKREDLREVAEESSRAASEAQFAYDCLAEVIDDPENPPECDNPDTEGPDFVQEGVQLGILNEMIANAETPEEAANLTELRDDWLQALLQTTGDDVTAANEAHGRAQERLDKLGEVPEIEENYSGALSLRLRKPYRSGIVITPYFDLSGSGTGYKGKPKNADFGGKGITDSYNSTLGFSIEMPLARGKGEESVAAFERASLIDYDASLDALTHSASASVFSTIISYWNVVAAQQTLEIWKQSLTLQNRLVELTDALIETEELAAAELSQTQARQADVQAQVEDSRRALHAARVSLAQVIGLEVPDETAAPLAADSFPTPESDVLQRASSAAMANHAVGMRYDYKSAIQVQESGKVLWKAAVIDLKPQVDLTLDAFYSGYDENGNVLKGIEGALLGNWTGPSGSVALAIDWPVQNNVQLGQLQQRRAAYRQRAISTVDLARTIRSGVVLALGALRESADQILLNGQAVEFYRKSIDAEVEKLRLGSSTVSNTILTEQRMTSALLGLINSQKTYAQLLAQLRFETGTLISEEGDGKFVSEEGLLSIPSGTGM